MEEKKIIVIGITGASGAVYGIRLVQELLKSGHQIHLIITEAGWQVFQQELDWDSGDREAFLDEHFRAYGGQLHYHSLQDFQAPIASGSYRTDGMVVVPCSMGTLAKIANGISGNLLERAADVMLKEGKKLILIPRETPLNSIHLENMLTLSKAGARILPAMPGFYHKPQTIDQLIDHLIGKVLDTLDVPHTLFKRWGE